MTLQQVRLDDLTWADLMAQIRAAIPAESGGAWTLHAAVDPGVTLLELYAAQLEDRLYWLDRIPDALVLGILRLLGVPPPRGAVPASTVLAVTGGAGVVPEATTMYSPGDPLGVVLSTEDDVTVLPIDDLRLLVDGRDRTGDLQRTTGADAAAAQFGAAPAMRRSGVDVLPADGGPAHAEIVMTVSDDAVVDPRAELSLALLIEPDGDLPAQWSPDAVSDVPPPAHMDWSYRDPTGGTVAFPAAAVHDGTAGLRRSGIVRLAWPRAWLTGSSGSGAPVHRTVVVRTEAATFAAPPRLVSIWPNAVIARHRRRYVSDADTALQAALEAQVRDWLPLPGRALEVADGAGALLDEPGTVELHLTERDGREHAWHPTSDFAFHGPGDRVFVVDRDHGVLRFGDGLTGRIPVAEVRADGGVGLRVLYELGGGAAGNLGSGLRWELENASHVTATNIVAVAGGEDSETLPAARARVGAELSRRYRAVTVDDHRAIATDVDTLGVAVARVHVGVGRHPSFPCDIVPGSVTVVVVPEVRRDAVTDMPVTARPHPDPGVITTVRRRLAMARLAGSEIHVEGPSYRTVQLLVTLTGGVADPVTLQAALATALGRHLDPLIGKDGSGWPFGGPLRPSELLGVARDAAGTAGVVVAVAIGLDGVAPHEDCDDVKLRTHELPTLADVQLTVAPTVEADGGLR